MGQPYSDLTGRKMNKAKIRKQKNIKIGTHIIPEMQRKCALLEVPRGYALEKALISLYGPDNSLKDTGYFHHFVTLDDIL